ncbi:MAG TPA: DinB family protein [Longimicrobium sp.]|nr:DinB family protein [Longimicrobium sp.]
MSEAPRGGRARHGMGTFTDEGGTMGQPEFWMRGITVDGISPALQPVAHALLQALEDLDEAAAGLSVDALWARPGGAASAGFHLRHLAGSLDRLTTYARGEALTDAQLASLRSEQEPGEAADALLAHVRATTERALDQLRGTPDDALDEARFVGRARLPSSVRGLLYHAGEHTSRHTGQVVTTAKIVHGLGGG